MIGCPYKKRTFGYRDTQRKWCEDMMIRYPWQAKREASWKPTLPTLWSWVSASRIMRTQISVMWDTWSVVLCYGSSSKVIDVLSLKVWSGMNACWPGPAGRGREWGQPWHTMVEGSWVSIFAKSVGFSYHRVASFCDIVDARFHVHLAKTFYG
jgi:hypothetical protein